MKYYFKKVMKYLSELDTPNEVMGICYKKKEQEINDETKYVLKIKPYIPITKHIIEPKIMNKS